VFKQIVKKQFLDYTNSCWRRIAPGQCCKKCFRKCRGVLQYAPAK